MVRMKYSNFNKKKGTRHPDHRKVHKVGSWRSLVRDEELYEPIFSVYMKL